MYSASESKALLAVCLPLALLLGSVHGAEPMYPRTDALPGQCMCDVEYCCSGVEEGLDSPCEILSVYAPLTSGETVEGFCAPYLDGTLDNSTYVCEAILADEKYTERFVEGGSEASVWLGVEAFEKCEDLVLDMCPVVDETKVYPEWGQYVINGWGSYGKDTCASFSRQLDMMYPGLSLVAHAGCVSPPDAIEPTDQQVFAMYNELINTEYVDDLQTCPVFADGVFTDETASGQGYIRWQCYDLYEAQKEFEGNILVNETSGRFMYFSLGRIPCDDGSLPGGVLPPAEGGPSDDSSGRGSLASALSLAASGILAMAVLGLSLVVM